MGMELCVWKPRGCGGMHFDVAIWAWYPLWRLCVEIAPELTGKVEKPWSNDGDGLGDTDSQELASAISEGLASGAVTEIAVRQELAGLPDEVCAICSGTGNRVFPCDKPFQAQRPCDGCGGLGKRQPWITDRILSDGFVRGFTEFLNNCGGFSIY